MKEVKPSPYPDQRYVSNCCQAQLYVHSSDEGTSFAGCFKCGEACTPTEPVVFTNCHKVEPGKKCIHDRHMRLIMLLCWTVIALVAFNAYALWKLEPAQVAHDVLFNKGVKP